MRCGGRGGEEVSIIAKLVVDDMAWCRIAHLGGELAICVWIAERLVRVVEICTTKAELRLRSGHTSWQNQQQI
eukprot:1126275-Rhodomonas_salina.1